LEQQSAKGHPNVGKHHAIRVLGIKTGLSPIVPADGEHQAAVIAFLLDLDILIEGLLPMNNLAQHVAWT
jgi:hypothetical protein